METFGERLKELRLERKLSLMQLSKDLGITDTSLCRWEKGQADIKGENIIKLAKYFDVSADYLLGMED